MGTRPTPGGPPQGAARATAAMAALALGGALAFGLLPTAARAAPATGGPGASVAAPLGASGPRLVGKTTDGRTVDLRALRGQVVMVLVWSSQCPVCLNKMPEIRANLAGWAQQGFQVVSVNTDPQPEPLREWEALRQLSIPGALRWPSLWAHAPGFASSLALGDPPARPAAAPAVGAAAKATAPGRPAANHGPFIYVVDRQGQLRFEAAGRMPPEVWDAIAELL